jgi:hypothetical protein
MSENHEKWTGFVEDSGNIYNTKNIIRLERA